MPLHKSSPKPLRRLAIALTFICFGNLAEARSIPKLKVGVVLPLSGTMQSFGQEALKGIRLAQSKLQATEPALATHLELVVMDNSSSPTMTTKVAEAFLKKGGHLLLGSISNTNTANLTRVAVDHKKILISPVASNFSIPKSGSSYIYQLRANDTERASTMGEFAFTQMHYKRGIMLLSKDEQDHAAGKAFESSFKKAGGDIARVFTVKRDLSESEAIRLSQEISGYKPDFIFTPLAKSEIPSAMAALPVKTPTLTHRADTFDALAKLSADSKFYIDEFSPQNPDTTTQTFAALYHSEYDHPPTGLAALMHDSVMLLADVLKRSHTNMTRSLELALLQTQDVPGSVTKISLYKNRKRPLGQLVVIKFHDGVKVFESEVKLSL